MNLHDLAFQFASSQRILVLGSAGSGKTTFSIHLGNILGLEIIHLDKYFWNPGWVATPQPRWREIVASLTERESWIMDGTYENSLDLRIPAADSIVVIQASRWTCLWRVLKRKATIDDQNRPDAPAGQKLDIAFLRYVLRYPDVTQPLVLQMIRKIGMDRPMVQLEGPAEIEAFLQALQRRVASRT